MAETLLFKVENGVGWIVLNRPEARNAMNAEMRQAYLDALARCAEDEAIRAVVLTATGKGFCTGADLSGSRAATGATGTPHPGATRDAMRPSQRVIRAHRIPDERVLIDHNNEETLPLVLDTGCWAGHSIYPDTKMDEQRMVALVKRYGSERIIINSAADWGLSDPLKVPKTVRAMRDAGIEDETIRRIAWENPVAFFAQSGRLELAPGAVDQRRLWEGNSVLRGQTPVFDR
jgi:hypothetical protein